ncbi:TlpA family protein disulfide reductase [Cellulomonas carbonis]|uniref:Thiol-disulfide isomerase n=1 Tax=Cellulomonas carbonis T26 TaxID=947969 RepID=A0A0A0BXU7_9CELL|nr:TlpA disulfide reductase family protein [Cellulomonas carbonis]KGM12760.1 thiol-disulfide isomerase [Cellulomonas carbonis T26]
MILLVLVLVTAGVVAVQLTGFLSAGQGAAAEGPSVAAGNRTVTEYAPEDRGEPVTLSGTGLTGEAIDIAAWRGDVVVINVWGSWCAPCREEAPILAATSAAYADQGVRFVGVNVRDNPAAAIAFEESYGIIYPSIDDRNGKALLSLADHLPGAGVPVTLLLDRDGRPAARVLGAVQESTLTALLDTVLAEPATSS